MMLAAGAIAGNSKIVLLLLLVSLAGLAVAVVMLLLHKADGRRLWHYCHCVFDIRYDRAAGRAALPPADSERVRIPFGVAIALGLWGCLL